MSETTNGQPRPDRWEYVKNRAKFYPEDLLPYAGQWIAWSLDGSRVVAHHEDLLEASRLAHEAGFGDEDVNWDRIPEGGEPESIL